MVNTELITRSLSFLLIIATAFFIIPVLIRAGGKFKKSLIFLLIAIIILFSINLAGILDILFGFKTALIRAISNILVTLMILLSVISMKRMIDGIDGHYKKRIDGSYKKITITR